MKKFLFSGCGFGVLAFCIFLFLSQISVAQKQANHWYFGSNAGVDFTSGSPVAVTNGALSTSEGCSGISDSAGTLLFYTDGINVYNSSNIQMPNGFGLNGNSSSSQAALVVKDPGSDTLYYIFTTDAMGGSKGLCYSTVDMTLQGGLGDIVLKNQLLLTPVCEHLSGTFHANGKDVWITVHQYGSNAYYSYLVTASGISAPVITSIGSSVNNSTDAQGSMKFSDDGSHIASPFETQTFYELFDFDNSTGILSNYRQLNNSSWQYPFAVEFSPSGRFLYAVSDVTSPIAGNILQMDVSLSTASAITSSAILIGTYSGNYVGSLQTGPDGKIYAGECGNAYIGVINSPDVAGTGCNFNASGAFLSGKSSNYGLPNYVTNFFRKDSLPIADFMVQQNLCTGICANFTNQSINATSYQWSFQGATTTSSTVVSPSNICYNNPGQFDVQLIASNKYGSDTLLLHNYITVSSSPGSGLITANPDSVCPGGSSYLMDAGSAGSIQWQSSFDGINFTDISSANDSGYNAYNITQPMYFRVKSSNGCGTDSSSSKMISIIPQPVAGIVTSSRDTICEGSGQKSTLNVTGNSTSVQWQSSPDGIYFSDLPADTSSSYITPPSLMQTTYYRIMSANNCGADSSNIVTVHIIPGPVASFNYTINGTTVTFNSDSSSSNVISYRWTFGNGKTSTDSNPVYNYDSLKIYNVCLTVYNGSNCSFTECEDIDLATGINDISSLTFISFYPNPAGNALNLAVNGIEGNYQLKIYDVLGQQVLQQQVSISNKQVISLQLANLRAGTYQLILFNTNQYFSKPFVHFDK